MKTLLTIQVYHKGKHIGTERLTEKGWEWRMFELDPDKKERWVYGVFAYAPELKRVVDHQDNWISVTDELPTEEKHGQKVLIHREMNDSQKLMVMSIHETSMVKHCDEETKWHPLPASPKKSKK